MTLIADQERERQLPWERDWNAQPQSAPQLAPDQRPPWERDWTIVSGGLRNDEPSRAQAFGYSAADAASFGFGDEGAGVIAGVGAVLGGQDYALAYRQRVDAARTRLEEARARHPMSSLAGTMVGAGATFLVPGGAAVTGTRLGLGGVAAAGRAGQVLTTGRFLPFGQQALSAAARGRTAWNDVRPLLAQSYLGAGSGAAFGTVYGAGSANDGNRLSGAGVGAALGAIGGAISPAMFQGLGNAGRFIYQNPALRTSLGGAGGAAVGYTQGDTPEERQQNAWAGAAFGAGLSAGSRPVLRAAQSAWRNPVAAFGNQTGMSIGVPPVSSGGGAQPEVERGVVRSIDRTMGRARMGVDDLAQHVDDAQASPPLGRRLADVNDEFSAELDALANQPGQTFMRAQEVARERAARLPEHLQSELREQLGVTTSPAQALDEIRAGAANASDGYERVLAQTPAPRVLQERIVPLLRTPEMQPVLARRFRVEDGQAQLARVRGQPQSPRTVIRNDDGSFTVDPRNVTGRSLHELKVSIDDELSAAVDRRSLSPAGRGEQQLLDDYREAFLAGMDDALPGYATVRAQRGGLYDAERSLGLDRDGVSRMGRRLLSLRPDELTRRMRETVTPTGRTRPTTPFERQMYRIAVADELIGRIDDYVSAAPDKVRNAGEIFDRLGLHNRLRVIFNETPEAIDAFLSRAIERAQMLRRAGSWTRNSFTERRRSRGDDRARQVMAEAGGALTTAASGNPIAAAGQLTRTTWNALRGQQVERENDALGAALLRSIERGNPDDEAFVRTLMRALRDLERQRISRASAAAREGGQGGLFGSGTEETLR